MSAIESSTTKSWFPLESNPTIMTTYLKSLGLITTTYSFQDIFSIEDWALELLTKPILGVLFVYPITEKQEEFRYLQQQQLETEMSISSELSDKFKNVFFMKQIVGNACGTIALLHCIGNVKEKIEIISNSFLDRFFQTTKNMTPDEIAQVIFLSSSLSFFSSHSFSGSIVFFFY